MWISFFVGISFVMSFVALIVACGIVQELQRTRETIAYFLAKIESNGGPALNAMRDHFNNKKKQRDRKGGAPLQ